MNRRMKRLVILLIFAAFLVSSISNIVLAEDYNKIFKTRYTTIHYNDDKELSDFIWRLGGSRFEISQDKGLASSRIDRIIEKVNTILGLWPKMSNVDIYLKRGPLDKNEVAYYDNQAGDIYISVDYVTDGVFAHEIAHLIINRYFSPPPSSKVQEILTQYVDKYLWSDY